MHHFDNQSKIAKNSHRRRFAFTLAEVLITLGIIGVVAAMTIPTLINNNQKTQYVTGLKKAYAQISQALVQMAAENGCAGDLACTGLFQSDDRVARNMRIGNEFVKYFKVVKNCDVALEGCFSDKVATDYTGTDARWSLDQIDIYRFVTADGMSISLDVDDVSFFPDCESDFSSTGTGPLSKSCGELKVDINGIKGPNNMGRDIFIFVITNGTGPLLYPTTGGATECTTANTYGWNCAARIINEGWKMNY